MSGTVVMSETKSKAAEAGVEEIASPGEGYIPDSYGQHDLEGRSKKVEVEVGGVAMIEATQVAFGKHGKILLWLGLATRPLEAILELTCELASPSCVLCMSWTTRRCMCIRTTHQALSTLCHRRRHWERLVRYHCHSL